jgi:hypothetical protein
MLQQNCRVYTTFSLTFPRARNEEATTKGAPRRGKFADFPHLAVQSSSNSFEATSIMHVILQTNSS